MVYFTPHLLPNWNSTRIRSRAYGLFRPVTATASVSLSDRGLAGSLNRRQSRMARFAGDEKRLADDAKRGLLVPDPPRYGIGSGKEERTSRTIHQDD